MWAKPSPFVPLPWGGLGGLDLCKEVIRKCMFRMEPLGIFYQSPLEFVQRPVLMFSVISLA